MKFALASLMLALAAAGCSSGGPPKPPSLEHFFDNFKTVVASAEQDGYTPYWLGRGFQAGGLEFRGPFAGDIGFSTGITGGGVEFHYQATIPGGGEVSLSMSLFSQQAWKKSLQNRAAPPGAIQKIVPVGTHNGQLVTVRDPAGVARYLVVQLGATTLFAIVDPSTPQPDPNPFADEATFLAVMQNLRPYPQ